MFDSKYKEAFEDMKLTDSFKSGLVNMMKKESTKPVPRKRLALAAIAAVILVSTSVVFATNYATKGQLFKSVMSGFGYDPQNTTSSLAVITEATEVTEAPTATPTAAATKAPTATPTATATPSVTPTVTPSTTPTAVPEGRIAPTVSAAAGSNSVTVSWTKITSPDLVGYKVVASKSDSTPKYSENGYYKWITNADTTSCTISNGAGYNGGDVGTFSGGTKYYFSVTAVYGEEWQTVAGNAVAVTMPGAAVTAAPTDPTAPAETTASTPTGRIAPSVNASAGSNSVTVTWNKIDSPDLVGYKVVASKSCSSPIYDKDGYYKWITDRNTTSCTIKNGAGYNNGDVGTFSGGTSYYFSVTAIYGDEWQKIAGNAVQVTMPGTAPVVNHAAPSVSAAAGTNCVTVSWNALSSSDLQGYKVVASPTCTTPRYSENGYFEWITDLSRTSCTINVGAGYNGGDVGTFKGGTNYYFSVTAVYSNEKVAGNAVAVVMPGAAPTEPTVPTETTTAPTDMASRVAPSVSAAAGTGCVTVTWARIDSPDLIGYKVVASPSVANPVYDANGYYEWITDRNITSCTINTGAGYHDGDVGTFTSGTNYNFSVTAIYGSEWQKIAGNAVPVVMP